MHLIVLNKHRFRDKHLSDCTALSRAIRYSLGANVPIHFTTEQAGIYGYDYVWYSCTNEPLHPGKKIRYDTAKLLWYKFCINPLDKFVSSRKLYDIVYTGSGETARMLELLNSPKFQSVSYGTGKDSKVLSGHACRSPISYSKLQQAIDSSTAILLKDDSLGHTLAEALANDKLILIDAVGKRTNLFDKWHYVSRAEDIATKLKAIPVGQMAKQYETKSKVWALLRSAKLVITNYV